MRKYILTLMASLLSCSAASAFWPEATDSNLEIGVGYRNDTIKWKTEAKIPVGGSVEGSGSGNKLKLSSDLHWKDLSIWFIEGRGKYVTCDNIYLRGSIDYGWITSGKVTDTDKVDFDNGFEGNSSSSGFDFARSKANTKGNVYDGKIAIGYQFKWCDDSLSIAPLVGYAWQGQHLRMHNLRQEGLLETGVASESLRSFSSSSDYSSSDYSSYDYSSSSSSSSGSGFKSKYHARWNGPFIGFDLDYRFCCDWTFFVDYEYHWVEYHGKARWNLREDLVSGKFTQHARNGSGNVFDFGVKWDFCECWTLGLRGEFQWFYASKGHDRAKVNNESIGDIGVDTIVKTPLKNVTWDTGMIVLDLGWVF